jgi:hypothetical protein
VLCCAVLSCVSCVLLALQAVVSDDPCRGA